MDQAGLEAVKAKQKNQYVCLVCGFNMIGYYPEQCPFCGADKSNFITSEQCSERFEVVGTTVNASVTSFRSVPALGLEHAAYRVETGGSAYWIDCPSCFDESLEPVELITFTHHHFLGASNLYREAFPARVRIHRLDSQHDIIKAFTFDELFDENFSLAGIEAFHINGHTPGFTFYLFEDVLFCCDYVFLKGAGMGLNPFGPEKETVAGLRSMKELIKGRKINQVCGYNYVIDFDDWNARVDKLLADK